MPLVEVVRGEQTDGLVVARCAALSNALGKTPVVVADVPGFLVNRMLAPYMNEAVYLREEGVDLERIDRIAMEFGMPMGPFALLDEVGIDVAAHVAHTMHEGYGDRMRPLDLADRMVERGWLGKKSGGGFYLHSAGDPKPRPDLPEPTRLSAASGGITDEQIRDRLILAYVNEALHCLAEGVAAGEDDIDLASVFGTGFAPFRGGVLGHARSLDPSDLRARLEALHRDHGERSLRRRSWRPPAPPWPRRRPERERADPAKKFTPPGPGERIGGSASSPRGFLAARPRTPLRCRAGPARAGPPKPLPNPLVQENPNMLRLSLVAALLAPTAFAAPGTPVSEPAVCAATEVQDQGDEIAKLRKRIAELEKENARLRAQLSQNEMSDLVSQLKRRRPVYRKMKVELRRRPSTPSGRPSPATACSRTRPAPCVRATPSGS